MCVGLFWGSQGVEGASAAAHALSLSAEDYGNDVSGHLYILSPSRSYKMANMQVAVKLKEICYSNVRKSISIS